MVIWGMVDYCYTRFTKTMVKDPPVVSWNNDGKIHGKTDPPAMGNPDHLWMEIINDFFQVGSPMDDHT